MKKISLSVRSFALIATVAALAACGHPTSAPDGSIDVLDVTARVDSEARDARDAPIPPQCTSDRDCSDGIFCNGAELCMPGASNADGRGCAPAALSTPCLNMQTCSETSMRCVSSCGHSPDADGDGHRSVDCGGDDCDDSDPNRFPGNAEVCDATNHDEDCDARTFGFRDLDMDGYVDHQCCNADATGALTCGDDCNDSRSNMHPNLAESCDGLDNNCNGTVDEGVLLTFYLDLDGDGFGQGVPGLDGGLFGDGGVADAGFADGGQALAVQGCMAPPHYAAALGDCDDSAASVHPGAREICDAAMVDEDCDGVPNPPSLCSCSGVTSEPCTLRGACAAGRQQCIDGSWGACSIQPVAEVCNGIDDNCNDLVDEGLTVRCFPDGDNDGYANAGATASQVCPVPGRDSFAGCPPNTTNRPPTDLLSTDCNDTNSTINPGEMELCDVAMVDENCDGISNPPTQCNCTDGNTRACATSGACGSGNQTCSGGQWGACSVHPVTESCNGIDDDCNGIVDDGLTIRCYADQDNDGYAAAGTASIQSCPVTGRDNVGGCPTNQTNRAPTSPNIDCNDTNAAISPGAVEVCDAAMVDENCDGMANPAALCSCSGSASQPCPNPGVCAAGTETCSGGSWGSCSILPLAEVCNGLDDNCNGMVDEGLTVTCYTDVDNDGYAATGATTSRVCPVSGREAVGGCPTNQTNRVPIGTAVDCLDTNAAINPGAIELCDAAMVDENCDGVANPASLCSCSGTASRTCPLSGACASGTETCSSGSWGACSIGPVAEACNGVDDNCNGMVDEGLTVTCYPDADNDTYPAPGALSVQSCPVAGRASVGGCPTFQTNRAPTVGNTDCNATDPSVNPGAAEVCDAAMVDENCDGVANPASLCACSGVASRSCTQPGACAAGTQTCSSGSWGICSVQPVAEICNGIDDNCNGTIDEGLTVTCYVDADNDGFAALGAGGSSQCLTAGRTSVGGCPVGYTNRAPTAGNADCADNNSAASPAATEVCNGVDDNCNGTVDEGTTVSCYADLDNDSYAPSGAAASNQCPVGGRSSVGGCPVGYTNRAPTAGNIDCLDSNAGQNPGQTEVCNGVDDNCNGATDEGTTVACYVDADNDTFALMTATVGNRCPVAGRAAVGGCDVGYTNRVPVAGAADCLDSNSAVNPGASEVCNGADDNCNAMIDEGLRVTCYTDNDNDTYSPGGAGSSVCIDATRLSVGGCPSASTNRTAGAGTTDCADNNATVFPGATEVCNGIDDNCNGTIDEGVSVVCYPDSDDDGYAAAGATAQPPVCPVAGRGLQGGCPFRQTFRAAVGANIDCNDAAPAVHPTAVDICNGIDDDCNLIVDDPATADPACTGTNAVTACRGGTCAVLSCTWMHADCDGNALNGCEADLTALPNCGGCGVTCGVGGSCISGRCEDTLGVATFSTVSSAGHTCAVRETGGVSCWGTNGRGELGLGGSADGSLHPFPSSVTGLSGAAAEIANGYGFSCARMASGAVQCWGSGGAGQLGNGGASTSTSPVTASGLAGASQIAVNSTNVCARAGSRIYCWGDNSYGQIGDGTYVQRNVPTLLPNPTTATNLSVGGVHACTVIASGNVQCWGHGNVGQLGDGTTVDHIVPANVLVSPGVPLTGAVQVAAGQDQSCAVLNTGAVRCWGGNLRGQIGNGNTTDQYYAVLVPGLSGVTRVTAGSGFTCALFASGQVSCWGLNAYGGIGNGAGGSGAPNVLTPAPVSNLFDAVSLYSGGNTSCVRRATGQITCWGQDAYDECGDGQSNAADPAPVNAFGPLAAVPTQVETNGWTSCARYNSGHVECWGDNGNGNLGNNTVGGYVEAPVGVTGLNDAFRISSGQNQICALRTNQTISCWGANPSGEIGDGSLTDRHVPTPVAGGFTNFVEVAAGNSVTCGRRATGTVLCWGSNASGALGDGTMADRPSPSAALPVSGLNDAVQIASTGDGNGEGDVCARRATGAVVCWGAGSQGQLGDGTTPANRNTPTTVALSTNDALDLDLGYGFACVIQASGGRSVACWGGNSSSQLGDGTTTAHTTPVSAVGVSAALELAVGAQSTCIRKQNEIGCWGDNSRGEVGDGTTLNRFVYTPSLTPPAHVTSLSSGASNGGGFYPETCAIEATTGRIYCWGFNAHGSNGDGTLSIRLSPTHVLDTP